MASGNNETLNPELESFREQWLSDLQSQKEKPGPRPRPSGPAPAPSLPSSASASRTAQNYHSHAPPPPTAAQPPPVSKPQDGNDEDSDYEEEYLPGRTFIDDSSEAVGQSAVSAGKKKLVSALDHYEEAMVKEAQGNMGDSLRLYRQAYRLDTRVDKVYHEKHHAAGAASTSAKVPKAKEAPQSPLLSHPPAPPPEKQEQPQQPPEPIPIDDLIASFAALKVEPQPPIIEGDIPPPCPISRVPDEILVHILNRVAVADVGDFARLSLVCKRLAFLVASEQRIWKRVCLGGEFGFGGLPRRWARGVEWKPLDDDAEEGDGEGAEAATALTKSLTPAVYPSWKDMFRTRPRIRFNGCYISTVNYIRSGLHTANHANWGSSPVLIVTYYRYLRFFRDGTLISLLTTLPPLEVVHALTREQLLLHRPPHAHPTPSVMQHAFRGRWRLSSSSSSSSSSSPSSSEKPSAEEESDLFVETEGVDAKYTYHMDLSLQSAGKAAARNNKLAWKRFYCYNKLTDDWGDFHLKNDKPFFFSRVRSYGVGGDESKKTMGI